MAAAITTITAVVPVDFAARTAPESRIATAPRTSTA